MSDLSRSTSSRSTSTRSSRAPAWRSTRRLLVETGFDLDRAWMVVDSAGRFVIAARAAAHGAVRSRP